MTQTPRQSPSWTDPSRKEIGSLYSRKSDKTKIFMWRRGLPKKPIQITLKTTPSHNPKALKLFSPSFNHKKTAKDYQISWKSLKYRQKKKINTERNFEEIDVQTILNEKKYKLY